MRIVFIYKNIILGGCELLINKLASKMIETCEVQVLCNTIDETMLKYFNNNNINVVIEENWNLQEIVGNDVQDDDYTYYITFFLNDFLDVWLLKNSTRLCYLYVVHPNILHLEESPKDVLKKRLFKKYIEKNIVSHNFIFMDEQCLQACKNSYEIDSRISSQAKIVRICVDDLRENLTLNRENRNNINILTIARAEFPFKGYLIGLVKWFNKFCANDARFRLVIISYGPNVSALYDEYNSLNDRVKKQISIIGKTDNNQLKNYYLKADFYIGMGTTVLEASQMGIISFATEPYNYELVVNKMFCECPQKIALDGTEENRASILKDYMLNIIDSDYNKKSKLHIDVVKKMYSLENNTIDMLNTLKENANVEDIFVQIIIKLKNIFRFNVRTRRKKYDNGK